MNNIMCQGKSSWPELVGVKGEEAVKIIEKENPNVKARIVGENEPIDMAFFCWRVIVVVNDLGIVEFTPSVG